MIRTPDIHLSRDGTLTGAENSRSRWAIVGVWLAVAGSVLAGLAVCNHIAMSQSEQRTNSFVVDMANGVRSTLSQVERRAFAARGLICASRSVDAAEWDVFMASQVAPEHGFEGHPELVDMAYLEISERASTHKDPSSGGSSGGAAKDFTFRLATSDRGTACVGSDEPAARDAMIRSVTEDRLIVGPPCDQHPSPEGESCIAAYLPVFNAEAHPTTPEARRELLRGWIIASVSLDVLKTSCLNFIEHPLPDGATVRIAPSVTPDGTEPGRPPDRTIDLEMRSTPVEWAGGRLDVTLGLPRTTAWERITAVKGPLITVTTIAVLAGLLATSLLNQNRRGVQLAEQLSRRARQGEGRFRKVIETAMDAVVTLTSDGVVTGWNQEAARVFGYSHDEAIGSKLLDLLFDEQTLNELIPGRAAAMGSVDSG
ncbi:MAG: PAS domain-containing protein, partial [Phycisphaerales bacterium]